MVDNQLYKTDSRISGIQESKDITENVLFVSLNIFKKYFEGKDYSLFSWGGVARREMGPFSDLDLIILSKRPSKRKIELFKKEVQHLLPSHRLDILEVYTIRELQRLAQIDGTDRQALLFLRKEYGYHNTKMAEKIRKDSRNNLREIFHICANLEFAYPNMFNDRNIKFGEGRIKYYGFVHLLANYVKSDFDIYSTIDAFEYLSVNRFLDEKIVKKAIESFDVLLGIRNSLQRVAKKEVYVLEEELIGGVVKDLMITKEELFLSLKDNKEFALLLYDSLKKIALDMACEELDPQDVNYLYDVFLESSKKAYLKDSVLNMGEICRVVTAYATKDSKLLDSLALHNPYDWYVLYGIANNTNVKAKTLWRLICSSDDSKAQELYTDFAWRNIYLYIAKNPVASRDIRKYICNYPKARPMDVEAALKGLK